MDWLSNNALNNWAQKLVLLKISTGCCAEYTSHRTSFMTQWLQGKIQSKTIANGNSEYIKERNSELNFTETLRIAAM